MSASSVHVSMAPHPPTQPPSPLLSAIGLAKRDLLTRLNMCVRVPTTSLPLDPQLQTLYVELRSETEIEPSVQKDTESSPNLANSRLPSSLLAKRLPKWIQRGLEG